MSPWKILFWKQASQSIIEFFNRLGQIQSPNEEVVLSCPLRRLPKAVNTKHSQCPNHFQAGTKKGG